MKFFARRDFLYFKNLTGDFMIFISGGKKSLLFGCKTELISDPFSRSSEIIELKLVIFLRL